ncbi:RIP metalloprotease RseP [Amycolatopsis xylanica]|uniref:RIP metalloprotease RseP n=1 Tax=Amycolatopsis xylanica TaxID=589385 RepID=A0A1H3R6A9_9PSEU|nr:site-2 protease family protein [Amycolatopsis xylanica]SDZ21170.1 RIP metalloprotease RseP [Amycolatopsis xylanica]
MVIVLGAILFALGICVSVALHEAGHMLTAKAFGMKVRRYFIGFGPTVFSFRRGETEYGLKWIPLGGFCDIAGMTALDEVTPEESKRAMWRFPTWKRTVVLSAGSAAHFILGFLVLYIMGVTMGLPDIEKAEALKNPDATISSISPCVRSATTKAEVEAQAKELVCQPGDVAPAAAGGMLAGDRIDSVNGKPVKTWEEAVKAIQVASGPTAFVVQRNGQPVNLTITVPKISRLQSDGSVKEFGMIGASRSSTVPPPLKYGLVDGVGGAIHHTGVMFDQTFQRLIEFPSRIPAVWNAIFGGERDPNTPVSVVGASIIGGEAVDQGLWEVFVYLLATLNFFIGVFNLLPLLPLDGGHIAVTWYERVRDLLRKTRGKVAGGPVDYTKLSAVTMVLVFLGAAVTLLTVTADIVNPLHLR